MPNKDAESNKMLKVLDWCYEKALNGVPGFDSAEDMANDYLIKHDSVEKAIDSLIAHQNMKSMTSGFLTGLGGLITLPVMIPANIASVMYVQMRMIAAIAHMRGYDLKSDQVKTLVFAALTGNSAAQILRDVGIVIGKKMAESLIKNKLPAKVLIAINKKVGFRLVAKAGTKSPIILTKAVPLVGGVIGAAVDGISTTAVAKASKKVFI